MGGKWPGCRNIKDEQKKEMQRLRDEGYYMKEIADMFGVCYGTVLNNTIPRYIKDGYKSAAERDMALVKCRDERNMTWKEVAKEFHITQPTAINRYRRYKSNERTR